MHKVIKKLLRKRYIYKTKRPLKWVLQKCRGYHIPYTQVIDNRLAKQLFFDYFKQNLRKWPQETRNRYIHDKNTFERKLLSASNGILVGIESQNVVLGGGSIATLLEATDDFNTNFDLDIFIMRTPSVLQDVMVTLQHFERVAAQRQVQIHYILRGPLVEVLIPNERNVQIICTKYAIPEECFYNVDLTYVQSYYNWQTVQSSYLALDAYKRGSTICVRTPVKHSRIRKTHEKGYNITGSYYYTEIDDTYRDVLHKIETIKRDIDKQPQIKIYDDTMNMCHDAKTCYDRLLEQLTYRWSILRWEHFKKYHIKTDTDIFDQAMRVFSYNKYYVPHSWKNVDQTKYILGVDICNDFLPLVLYADKLTIVKMTNKVVTVNVDKDLMQFTSQWNQTSAYHISDAVHSTSTIDLVYNAKSSRVYDHAERPYAYSTIVLSKLRPCNVIVTFLVLSNQYMKNVMYEIVDMFITTESCN